MTAVQYARAWERRQRDFGGSLKREFAALGQLAIAVDERLLTEEVYSKPEDVTPTGRMKWRRTNFLAAMETMRMEEGGTRIVIDNLAPYAEPRHEANKPARRQINPLRTAHWRDDMLLVLGSVVTERLQRVKARVLRGT